MILSFSTVSKILHTFKFWFVLLIFYYLFSSSIYSLASLVKHSHYETFSDFYDFHEIVFLPPLFAWAYYFFSLGNKRYVNLFLFLQLLIKEEVGFFVATFALYIMLSKKDWRKLMVNI